GGEHRASTGFRCSNPDKTRAGSKVENRSFRHAIRVVEHVAGERLAAGPCECPIGWGHSLRRKLFFRAAPERNELGCEMKPYLRDERRRDQRRIGSDELDWTAHAACASAASGFEVASLRIVK